MKTENNIIRQSNLILGTYYLGKVFHYINMNVILYTILTQTQFGLYRGINSAAFLLANLDLEKAIMKFYPSFKNDPEKRAAFWGWSIIINTLIFLTIMGFFIITQFLGKGSNSSSQIYYYYPLIFVLGYVIQLAKVLKSWSIVLQQIVWPNILQNVVLEIFIGISFYFYYIGLSSFESLLVGMAIPYCLHLLLMVGYTIYTGETKISFVSHYIDRKFIRVFLTYAFFVIIASKVTTLLMRVDAVILGKLWGDYVVGKYMHILGLITLLDIPYKVGRQSVGPVLANSFAHYQQKKVTSIFKYAAVHQLLLASFVFMILYYNMSYFIPTSNQQETHQLLLLMGTAKVLNNFFSVGLVLLVLSHHYQYSILLSVLGLGNIMVNWHFIRIGGLYGAATAILFTTLLLGVASFLLIWYTMKIHPFSWSIFALVLLFCLLVAVEKWLPSRSTILDRIMRLTIPCLAYSAIFMIQSKNKEAT